MKWPKSLMLVRHDYSAYNALKYQKNADSLYQQFLAAFQTDLASEETRRLAEEVKEKYALGTGDFNTPLAENAGVQAVKTGEELGKHTEVPDVIFVSPYRRALATLDHLKAGWPELAGVPIVEDERIREQEHGLSILYCDWRVFNVFHPEQGQLRKLEGPYWYRYPQGENIPDVRERNRSWLSALVRDFSDKNVLVVTHHLNILASRANLERLSAEQFIDLDKNQKPINCGVTFYRGEPDSGKMGKLKFYYYNRKLY